MASLYKYKKIYGCCVHIYIFIYTQFTSIYKAVKKKRREEREPLEERKAVLSEEENEEEIAIITGFQAPG